MNEAEMREEKRTVPRNDLDMQFLVTAPVWGKMQTVHNSREQLEQEVRATYKAGEAVEVNGQIYKFDKETVLVSKRNIWAALEAVYNQDLRLGALDSKLELDQVRYYLDLAHDILQAGYPVAFVTCMARVATILEPSQSKKGWLRRMFNTIRQERFDNSLEPTKKKLWGGNNGRSN